jgi:hypothetical protein
MNNTETATAHAHVSTYSRDCDGAHGNEYVALMNDSERVSEWPELDFMQRILSGQATLHPEFVCTVKIEKEGFSVSEQTDEGFRSSEVRWCWDEDCDPDAGSVYDQYAEMSGY